MPHKLMIALFIRFYGHDAWMNDRYPTRDKIIPFRLFLLMYQGIRHVQAFERISSTHSSFHALAMVNSTDRNVVQQITEREFKEAHGVKE
jgi:hypothetical protein